LGVATNERHSFFGTVDVFLHAPGFIHGHLHAFYAMSRDVPWHAVALLRLLVRM
jgi:hypothetical protein